MEAEWKLGQSDTFQPTDVMKDDICYPFFVELTLNLQTHRIIESFGLEGTPTGHLVQPPRSKQGHH